VAFGSGTTRINPKTVLISDSVLPARLSDLLYGRYIDDSLFYDNTNIRRVFTKHAFGAEGTPEDWAVVMFDYHNWRRIKAMRKLVHVITDGIR
jgi:hypothetical protein